jgi:hypothetical protein
MIKEAIEKILSLAEPNGIDVVEDIRSYYDKKLYPLTDPCPEALTIHTLTGLVDWLDSDDYQDCMIQVVGPSSIRAIGQLETKWMARNIYVVCKLTDRDNFPFGRYMELEDFIIQFQCSFNSDEVKKEIINYLANIRGEQVVAAQDDGIAQEVAVQNKIGRLENIKMNPIVQLAPFRTFSEIEQPYSPFLLRLRQQKDTLPLVALFEADGGAWKNEAIKTIASYLKKQPIISEKKINVLA